MRHGTAVPSCPGVPCLAVPCLVVLVPVPCRAARLAIYIGTHRYYDLSFVGSQDGGDLGP